jgi:ankyrin repeat protein
MNLTDNDYRMLYAASRGDLSTIQILKQQGSRINFNDIESRSPLHIAACNGNQIIVEYLVANGADVMKKDSRGIDPVDDAINSGYQ